MEIFPNLEVNLMKKKHYLDILKESLSYTEIPNITKHGVDMANALLDYEGEGEMETYRDDVTRILERYYFKENDEEKMLADDVFDEKEDMDIDYISELEEIAETDDLGDVEDLEENDLVSYEDDEDEEEEEGEEENLSESFFIGKILREMEEEQDKDEDVEDEEDYMSEVDVNITDEDDDGEEAEEVENEEDEEDDFLTTTESAILEKIMSEMEEVNDLEDEDEEDKEEGNELNVDKELEDDEEVNEATILSPWFVTAKNNEEEDMDVDSVAEAFRVFSEMEENDEENDDEDVDDIRIKGLTDEVDGGINLNDPIPSTEDLGDEEIETGSLMLTPEDIEEEDDVY